MLAEAPKNAFDQGPDLMSLRVKARPVQFHPLAEMGAEHGTLGVRFGWDLDVAFLREPPMETREHPVFRYGNAPSAPFKVHLNYVGFFGCRGLRPAS